MKERIGQRIGDYRLLSIIGVGGYAEVYLGEHIQRATTAAIKVLRSILQDESQIEQFIQEARVIRLHHPNILPVLDFGIENRVPYLVMDYVPRGSIRQRHPRGTRVPLNTVQIYVKQVAAALQYAHDQGLIHRDVKPENMLLGPDDEVLLADFGIAGAAHSTQSLMGTSQDIVGTVQYMAPEQIKGQPRPASDQYALGIVVYEWLCGQPPFKGAFSEVIGQHLFSTPLALSDLEPSLPHSAIMAVMKSLAKEPKERFARIEDFAQALGETPWSTIPLENPPMTSYPTLRSTSPSAISLPPSTIPAQDSMTDISQWTFEAPLEVPQGDEEAILTAPSQRSEQSTLQLPSDPMSYKSNIGVTAPTLIQPVPRPFFLARVASSVYDGFIRIAHSMIPTASLAQATITRVKQLQPGSLHAICRGHKDGVRAVTWSPDSTYLATASNDGTMQIWNTSSGHRTAIYRRHNDVVHTVSWSPDGKYLVTASADKTVILWVSSTDQQLATYTDHTGEIYTVAWSPDSKFLVSAGADRVAHIWSTTTRERLNFYKGHEDWIRAAAWSPNGQYIATASNDKTVHIWDARTGYRYLTYHRHTDWVRSVAWSPDGTFLASAGNDRMVHIWDARTGQQLMNYAGHSNCWLGGVLTVAWSPTGKYVASAGEDQTAQVWEPQSGKEIVTYRHHTAPINALAWSLDGNYIATASNDKTMHIWWSA